MYVCACNGIRQKQVNEAIEAGATRWDQVHEFYDCLPCCGKCKEEIEISIAKKEPLGGSRNKPKGKRP